MAGQGPLAPGASIGILGTGQLGRMLASAAAKLGFDVRTFGPHAAPPAARVASGHLNAAYEDEAALLAFAGTVDVATYEFENIPPQTVKTLAAAGCPVRPGPDVLEVCQDRLLEKRFLRDLGLQTAPFFPVDTEKDLRDALVQLGGEGILKTRQFGYDGKGQVRLGRTADLAPGAALAAIAHAPAILEGIVPFELEVSQIVARGVSGQLAYYDLPHNVHREGILRESRVPAQVPRGVAETAQDLTAKVLEATDYVGVLAVEFFWSEADGLVANEIAPRVHNSGHWTAEACVTGQFEQHVRAVAGWPLGPTTRHSDAAMTNLIGDDALAWRELAADGRSLTLYGKDGCRPGRKMGHTVTLRPKA